MIGEILAGVGAAGSLVDLLAGSPDFNFDPANWDIDPTGKASRLASDYHDLNSSFNKELFGQLQKNASDVSGVDALVKMGGGASGLGRAAALAEAAKRRDAATSSFMDLYLRQQGLGLQAQEMDFQNKQFKTKGLFDTATAKYQKGVQSQNSWGSFFDQMIGLGGGMMGRQMSFDENAALQKTSFEQMKTLMDRYKPLKTPVTSSGNPSFTDVMQLDRESAIDDFGFGKP